MSSRQPLVTYGRKASGNREILHKPSGNLLPNTNTSDTVHEVSHPNLRRTTLSPKAGLNLSELEPSVARSVLQSPYSGEGRGFQVPKLAGTSNAALLSPGHRFSLAPSVELKQSNAPKTSSYGLDDHEKSKESLQSRTSSRRLKENMKPKASPSRHSTHTTSRDRLLLPLASPFTSRPVSPLKNPAETTLRAIAEPNERSRPIPRPLHRQSLSDTRLHGNVSGTGIYGTGRKYIAENDLNDVEMGDKNILTRTSLANLERRPSAPSLRPLQAYAGASSSTLISLNNPRNVTGNNVDSIALLKGTSLTMGPFVSYDFLCDSETYFLSSLDGTVNFNRPPSQMSIYDGEIDSNNSASGFFRHIRGRSTPKSSRPLASRGSSSQARSGNRKAADEHAEVVSTRTELKQYSSWISDSIVSPPTFYQRQKYDINAVELSPEDMELTQPISPAQDEAIGASDPDSLMSSGCGDGSPLCLQKTGSLAAGLDASLHDHESTETSTSSDQEENKNLSIYAAKFQNRPIQGSARTRSGTITQTKPSGGRTSSRRDRSGTIIQGGGGARRTRSGTVVQATKEGRSGVMRAPRHSSTDHEDQPQENDKSQEDICSCRSSDDELMLRSHSHHDLDAENLEWKVADPPSPVVKRLRRARRQYTLRMRNMKGKGKKGNAGAVNVTGEDEWEDGTEGDIEDDELDLLGNFVPESW